MLRRMTSLVFALTIILGLFPAFGASAPGEIGTELDMLICKQFY